MHHLYEMKTYQLSVNLVRLLITVVQMEIKIFRKLVIFSILVRARSQNKVVNRVNLVRLLITVVQMEIKIFWKLVIVLILVRMRSQNKVLRNLKLS